MIGILFWLCVLFVIYVYAGYPLLLGLLARLRPKPGAYASYTPVVTLIVAAYNEERVIGKKMENCVALDYPRDRLQILVMNDCSEDRTAEIVSGFAGQGVELITAPQRRGKMANVIHAIQNLARGEVILISDATNLYAPNVLRELSAPFADPTVGAVFGARDIVRGDGALGDSEGLYWKYESFIQEQETRLGCSTGAFGDIFAIRRSLFETPPPRVINDDFFIAMRLVKRGYRVIYNPKARTSERVSPTAQDEVTRRARMIAGRYQAISMAGQLLPFDRPRLVWQVLSHKFFRPLVPFAMIGALLANVATLIWPPSAGNLDLIRLAPPFNWIFIVAQLLFYLLALVGQNLERKNTLARMLYLPTFLVNSNLAALFGLYGFLTGKQSSLWKRVPRRDITQ